MCIVIMWNQSLFIVIEKKMESLIIAVINNDDYVFELFRMKYAESIPYVRPQTMHVTF